MEPLIVVHMEQFHSDLRALRDLRDDVLRHPGFFQLRPRAEAADQGVLAHDYVVASRAAGGLPGHDEADEDAVGAALLDDGHDDLPKGQHAKTSFLPAQRPCAIFPAPAEQLQLLCAFSLTSGQLVPQVPIRAQELLLPISQRASMNWDIGLLLYCNAASRRWGLTHRQQRFQSPRSSFPAQWIQTRRFCFAWGIGQLWQRWKVSKV
mmetsp:Transcript_147557/g.374837  ORF Transcript_147557/g.374837 Transcript_147557/m.374837 type:complete len:207 (-) Transcript_147557:121-741(-)